MSAFDSIRVRHWFWWWLLGLGAALALLAADAAPVGVFFAAQLIFAGWLFWLEKRHHLDAARLLGPRPRSWAEAGVVLLGLGMPAVSLSATVALYGALSYLAPAYVAGLLKDLQQYGRSLASAGAFPLLQNLLLVVAVVGTGPILEEMTFRGVILHRWTRRWGLLPAALLTSLFFCLLHLNLPGTFLLGLVLCAVYVRTGSLWLAIGLHAANNLAALLVGLLPGAARIAAGVLTPADLRRGLPWAVATLVVALPPLGVYVLRALRNPVPLPYFRQLDEPPPDEVPGQVVAAVAPPSLEHGEA